MQPTDLVDNLSKRDDIPEFAPGDTLKVQLRRWCRAHLPGPHPDC